jgi:Tfp pilus assembly protein PilP
MTTMRLLLVSALVFTFAAALEAQEPPPHAAPAAPGVPTPKAAPAPDPAVKPAESAANPAEPTAKSETPEQPSTSAKTDALVEPPGFTYSPDGRRDPFLSLVRRGVDPRSGSQAGTRPLGLAGLSVGEVTLRGTVRSREGFVAIMQGADRRAYIVRVGDRLFDGTVRTVSQTDVVILQQVNDPLSLETQREVRKVLRQPEAN